MDEQRAESEELVWQTLIEASASGGGILVQLASGAGVVPTAAGGAVAVVTPALLRMTREVIKRRQNRADRALITAAEAIDGLDILEERLRNYDERVELLGRVLEAAARTPLEKKIRALSRVLVDGLQDDADMGEAFMLADALADMEEPHVLLLERIHEEPIAPAETRTNQNWGWDINDISQATRELNPTLNGILAVLARHGLLEDKGRVTYPGGVGPAVWTISQLGRRAVFLLSHELDRLRQKQEEELS